MDTKKEEGFRSKAYKDTKGKKTVGYGFNQDDPVTNAMLPKDVRSGKRGITKPEADASYKKRMALAIKDAKTYLGAAYDNLDDTRKGVLHDMSYNMGLTSLSGFKKLKAAIEKRDWNAAADEIMHSPYAKKDVPQRAKRNADAMRGVVDEIAKEVMRQVR